MLDDSNDDGNNFADISLQCHPRSARAVFIYIHPDGERRFAVRGRVAQTIVALVRAGSRGITAAEMSCWAYRLGAYVHTLRREYDLHILTQHEEHEGGWHGRYVLVSSVTVLLWHNGIKQ
jgi:hypothetical protein